MFNATFNNISVISRRSVLLEEETGENYRPVAIHWQTVSHNVVSISPRLSGFRIHNVRGEEGGVGTDCIGSYKSNYYATTTSPPPRLS